ncbi:hypothetical protein E2C01_061434 [Portunus trituberculatus]|uniref:Secreted protein n=1 Tax=Portunus trituberculatus TaxID=210409 RepID=A0A5B7H3U9_PORTR|nr:hypothetical protein [Portunus trituberculatus]
MVVVVVAVVVVVVMGGLCSCRTHKTLHPVFPHSLPSLFHALHHPQLMGVSWERKKMGGEKIDQRGLQGCSISYTY